MERSDALVALSALAHETRLDVFRLLVRAGFEGMTPGAIARALEVPAPTLSFHLKELKYAGLIGCRREGRMLHYTAEYDATKNLVQFLTDNCCEGVQGCGAPDLSSPTASAQA